MMRVYEIRYDNAHKTCINSVNWYFLRVICKAKVAPVFKFSLSAETTNCKKWRLLIF